MTKNNDDEKEVTAAQFADMLIELAKGSGGFASAIVKGGKVAVFTRDFLENKLIEMFEEDEEEFIMFLSDEETPKMLH